MLTGFREAVLNAIPMDLKRAIGIGIGLFLAIIGLVNGGIVVNSEATLITLNPDLSSLPVLVFVVGLALTAMLVTRKMRGGLLVGILATTVFAIIVNQGFGDSSVFDPGIAVIPDEIVSTPDFGLLGNVSFGVFDVLGLATAAAAILAVMLSDFFDTMGTVVGLADEADLLDEDGKLPGINRVLLVDSVAAAAGGVGIIVVEHDVHRERGGNQRGRTNRPDVGGRRGAVPPGDLLLAARRGDPARGDRAGPGDRRLLHDAGGRGDLVARSGGRDPGAAHDRDDAVHVLDHERRRRGIPLVRRDQGARRASSVRCTR